MCLRANLTSDSESEGLESKSNKHRSYFIISAVRSYRWNDKTESQENFNILLFISY